MSEASKLDANFSILVTSMASTAVLNLGMAANPATGQIEKDLPMAKFNIDLLQVLKVKTKGNLSADEEQLLHRLIQDLQLHFVQQNK